MFCNSMFILPSRVLVLADEFKWFLMLTYLVARSIRDKSATLKVRLSLYI